MILIFLIICLISKIHNSNPCNEPPLLTAGSTISFKANDEINFQVISESRCENGKIDDIKVRSSNGEPLTTIEKIPNYPNKLIANIYLPKNEPENVNRTVICVKAIDNKHISSKESCFDILIDSSLPFLAIDRKKRNSEKTIIINQSLPLCNASSFALIFVYYWVMFIGMHLLSLGFLVSYMLRNIHESYETLFESYGLNNVKNTTNTNLNNNNINQNKAQNNYSKPPNNNNEMNDNYNNNNNDMENFNEEDNENENYEDYDVNNNNPYNERGFSNDGFNQQNNNNNNNNFENFPQQNQPRNNQRNSSVLYPLPKRDFFFQ